tara:strand:- start:417 stop:815 length:399 start_codon:yes stop_codon:yes gene_type:complete
MIYQLLLIEDDPIFTFLLKKGIEAAALEGDIHNFSNGLTALEFLTKEYSKEVNYIIFLDLNMPVMNGWQFMEKFEKIASTENCMVFVLTSSANQQDIDKLKEKPLVEEFVTKPITDFILKGIKKTVVAKFEN